MIPYSFLDRASVQALSSSQLQNARLSPRIELFAFIIFLLQDLLAIFDKPP